MADPTETIVAGMPNASVHVFTDAQLGALIAGLKPGPGFVGQAVSTVKTVNSDLIANIEALLADAKDAATGVHGAAVQLRTDVKANWVVLLLAAATVFNTVAIFFPAILRVL